ncbi:TPR-like protein [Dendrothele bispora CBS 962.96]|uniref:TPR-like protein n=1 Tax=Dendrothele bispora (strain CBS 962.96) TaxID=1314807 RepID=A0A4S8L988_DENBC|nr:TPR-like protein [Dendrothele bispora CBS 962.96]
MIASATPAVPIVFKGREDLVEQGVAILCQQALRFLAILGAGGMGKTSLALHIMDSHLVQNKFGERCYFMPCELFEDTESLVQGLIHVMELTMQENQSKQKVLFNHLQSADGDLLIVFDNFETPWNHGDSRIGVKNLLEKIVKYDKVSLIVTMRGPDGPGDIAWKRLGDQSGIPTLLPVSAKEAFKAFAGNKLQSSDDSESQIDSLLYQLEYVPLAIRLSAQHVKQIPLEELLSMWETDKTSILTEPTKPGRLTSVSFSIDLSLQIFKIEGQTLSLLSAISFLPNGIPFWVKNLPHMFQGEHLSLDVSALLNSSLIYGQNEGIKMLAPVKEHIHSKYPLGQDIIDQLERFYAQFLEDLPDNDMEAQPLLQIHINNIEKIFRIKISSGHSKTPCISAVNILYRFRRFVSVVMGLIDLILEKDKSIEKDDKIDLEVKRADLLRWMGRFQDAKDQVMSQLFQQIGNELGVAECLKRLGDIYRVQGRNDKAIQMISDALKQFQTFGNQVQAAVCLLSLGDLYRMQGRYDEATEMIMKAQEQYEEIGYKAGVADCLKILANSMIWLGNIYFMQARYKEASEMISEAQQLFQQIGNEVGAAECLQRLGSIYRMQGRNDDAIQMISDAQKQFQTFGNQIQAAECLWSLGELFRKQKKYDEATEMMMKAQKQFEEIGYKQGVADCLRILGRIYMDQAQYGEAADMFSNALRQYQNNGIIVDVALCYEYLGITYRLQGQYENAKEAFTEALRLLKGFPGEKYLIGWTLLEFGHLFFDMKDFVEARRKYEKARNVFDSHGQLEREVDKCSRALAKLNEAIKQ